MDENNKAKVADIGMGKVLASQDAIASGATLFWASPEQLQVDLCFRMISNSLSLRLPSTYLTQPLIAVEHSYLLGENA